ncbi:hypothetical protein CVT26_014624 [Gymnopilus dilepis]|uniref:Uncharacterized protein n=1 Tax=Gymnopilus dilepis TaxID=231916 RepID=A0A409VWP6_9AGAR|nr:hypothetical protein CVT26_014624 [Gymnopilus dilepis]
MPIISAVSPTREDEASKRLFVKLPEINYTFDPFPGPTLIHRAQCTRFHFVVQVMDTIHVYSLPDFVLMLELRPPTMTGVRSFDVAYDLLVVSYSDGQIHL